MLPRSHRLTKSADIQKIIKLGERLSTPYIQIFYLPNQADISRVACIAGKKVHKLATQRHKYQRWLREIAKKTLPGLVANMDLVFIGRPSIVKITSYQQLLDSLPLITDSLNNIE